MKYTRIIISGKVQGIGFREFIRKKSDGVVGYARNLKGGDVEIIAAGTPEAIANLVKECRKGPLLAKVSDVKVEEIELNDEFEYFFIRP